MSSFHRDSLLEKLEVYVEKIAWKRA